MTDGANAEHASPQPVMQVHIWGSRGSVPTPVTENLRVGGNTSCVEVRTPAGDSFIFDAGTGIRMLGLARPDQPTNLNIFLTHFHWDHLQGLPFFTPIYSPSNVITFHSGCPAEDTRRILSGQMANPYFPVKFDLLAAELRFEQIDSTHFDDVQITTFGLHHPGGACGYILSCDGARIVYATDHEHGDPAADARLLAAARRADLLIYDAQFTPEEYESHIGWGHSTWLEATRLAHAARVKQLLLFHHDPGHTDADMEHILEQARRHFPETYLAVEGMTIPIGRCEDRIESSPLEKT